MRARVIVVVCVWMILIAGQHLLSQHSVARAASCPVDRTQLVAPVHGRVVSTFSMRRCPGCRTTRGLTVQASVGRALVATADGEVLFAGQVAGVWWVVQRLDAPAFSDNTSSAGASADDTVDVTYGGFGPEGVIVRRGDRIRGGQLLGETPGRAYLGMRVAGRYVDPFACWGGARARLVAPANVVSGKRSR